MESQVHRTDDGNRAAGYYTLSQTEADGTRSRSAALSGSPPSSPCVTVGDQTLEFHTDLPLVDDYNIVLAEFARAPTGSSVCDPDSVVEDSGRTYHGYKDGKYFLPNDAAEQERLDSQHAALMILFQGKHGFAPVRNPENVLDVATGTGIWALEYARLHPESNVIGTDLSAIQPIPSVPNCQFVKDDAEEEWLYNGMQFDYVHLRFVFTCFNDQKRLMRHAFDNIKPGGWIEYQDSNMEVGSMDDNLEGTAMRRLFNLCMAGAAAVGRELRVAKHLKEWLIETGFVDVTERKMIAPGNGWPDDPRLKRVGQYTYQNFHDGVRGGAYKMLQFAGLGAPEIEQLCRDFQEQSGDTQYRWFWPIYIVYGRKPYDWEVNGSAAHPSSA